MVLFLHLNAKMTPTLEVFPGSGNGTFLIQVSAPQLLIKFLLKFLERTSGCHSLTCFSYLSHDKINYFIEIFLPIVCKGRLFQIQAGTFSDETVTTQGPSLTLHLTKEKKKRNFKPLLQTKCMLMYYSGSKKAIALLWFLSCKRRSKMQKDSDQNLC